MIAQGRPLRSGYADFAAAFATEMTRETALGEDRFAEAVAPETFVARRDRPGGPAPAALDAALAGYRSDLHGIDIRSNRRKSRRDEAATALLVGLRQAPGDLNPWLTSSSATS